MSQGRRFLFGWLVLALLLAQTLGLMHGQLHPSAQRLAHAHADAPRVAAQPKAPSGDWADKLFDGHQSDTDCRMFDQLSHGDAAPALPLLTLPLPVAAAFLDFFQGEALARWRALFDARGPPPVR